MNRVSFARSAVWSPRIRARTSDVPIAAGGILSVNQQLARGISATLEDKIWFIREAIASTRKIDAFDWFTYKTPFVGKDGHNYAHAMLTVNMRLE